MQTCRSAHESLVQTEVMVRNMEETLVLFERIAARDPTRLDKVTALSQQLMRARVRLLKARAAARKISCQLESCAIQRSAARVFAIGRETEATAQTFHLKSS